MRIKHFQRTKHALTIEASGVFFFFFSRVVPFCHRLVILRSSHDRVEKPD